MVPGMGVTIARRESREAIEQRRLADVGTADQDDGRKGPGHASLHREAGAAGVRRSTVDSVSDSLYSSYSLLLAEAPQSMIKVDIVNEVSKIADITKVKAEVAVDAVFDAMRCRCSAATVSSFAASACFRSSPGSAASAVTPAPARKCAFRRAGRSASSPVKTSRISGNSPTWAHRHLTPRPAARDPLWRYVSPCSCSRSSRRPRQASIHYAVLLLRLRRRVGDVPLHVGRSSSVARPVVQRPDPRRSSALTSWGTTSPADTTASTASLPYFLPAPFR